MTNVSERPTQEFRSLHSPAMDRWADEFRRPFIHVTDRPIDELRRRLIRQPVTDRPTAEFRRQTVSVIAIHKDQFRQQFHLPCL
jgi:hypothetical protein